MHIYSEIARRYGARTEEEVDNFFINEVIKLPPEVQQAIFDELIDSHGVPPEPKAPAPLTGVRPARKPPPSIRRIPGDFN